MFYKACLAFAIGIVLVCLVGAFSSASSLSIRQHNGITPSAQRYSRTSYIVPVPPGSSFSSYSSGSSRASYDDYRGGGPGTGK